MADAPTDDASERPAKRASLPDLQAALRRIDGRPYPAYRDLEHTDFEMGRFTLRVDGVQADPFAPPSRCHVRVPLPLAGFPADCLQPKVREVALRDFLTRQFCAASKKLGADQRTEGGGWGGSKGGELLIDLPGQHVLERTSVQIVGDAIEARFCVALPARGRTILGEWASQILTETLPSLVHASLYHAACDARALKAHLDAVEDQRAARALLRGHNLIAFVADGAILPRKSGASDLPLDAATAVPFASPPELAVELALPNAGAVRGMGIRRGVTLVAGGGFHGKSTLLEALQLGVYDQLPGDGRERVVTDGDAVKVRAEDGRAVTSVDISTFIDNLPYGRKTNAFTSADASGSTSQAAAIVEAVQAGASALLIDEDTSATNFMIRDARMQRLVAADREPIKPFIAHVRRLWTERQVSSIIVVGGAGDYFDVADTVLLMDSYAPSDATARAKAIAAELPSTAPASAPGGSLFSGAMARRCPLRSGLATGVKVAAGRERVRLGELPELDLSAVEQIVEHSQVRAIAEALLRLAPLLDGTRDVAALLAALGTEVEQKGLDALKPDRRVGNLALPRPAELAAALNRLRSLQVKMVAP